MANSGSGDSVVDRVVRLLEAFPEGSAALQLTELAERAGLPLTTAHRLVRQLAGHGLLDLGDGGSVRLGLRLWELVNRNSPTWPCGRRRCPSWRTSSRCSTRT